MNSNEKKFFINSVFEAIRTDKGNENVYETIQDSIMFLIALGILPFKLGYRIFKGIAQIHKPYCKSPDALESITHKQK